MRGVLKALCLVAALSCSPAYAADPTYSVTELVGFTRAYDINNRGEIAGWREPGVSVLLRGKVLLELPSLGGRSSALGLNDRGHVVGQSAFANEREYHAYFYANGATTDLGTLGGLDSVANDINYAGQIVGWAKSSSTILPFVYANGAMTSLGTLGGSAGVATAINNLGQIVGSADTAGPDGNNGPGHAFLYSHGTMVDLGTLGGSTSSALAVNANGWVVGTASTTGNAGSHAFLYQGGTMIDLGTLGGQNSFATGINKFGHIVGYSWMPDGSFRGFLHMSGSMFDLNTLLAPGSAWFIREAIDINDKGQIIAEGCLGTTRCAALLLNPIKTSQRR